MGCGGGCGGGSSKGSAPKQTKPINWGMKAPAKSTRGGSASPKMVGSGGAGRFGRPSVNMSFGKKKY